MTGAAMAESPLDEVARALREHQAARAQLERDLDDARRQLDAERSRARTASGELGALEAKRDAAEHALTDARAQLAAASARAQGLEQQRDALRTRVDALERAGTAHAERQTQLREMSERVQLLEDFAAKAGPTAATASEAIADVRARQRGLLEALSRAEAASDARVEAARAAAAREAEALEEARAAHAVRRAALVSALFFRDQAAHAREAQRDALGQAGLAQRERGALDEAYAGALERERCAHERASALSAQCARLHEHARALTAADDVRAASEAALAQEVRTLEQDIVAWQARHQAWERTRSELLRQLAAARAETLRAASEASARGQSSRDAAVEAERRAAASADEASALEVRLQAAITAKAGVESDLSDVLDLVHSMEQRVLSTSPAGSGLGAPAPHAAAAPMATPPAPRAGYGGSAAQRNAPARSADDEALHQLAPRTPHADPSEPLLGAPASPHDDPAETVLSQSRVRPAAPPHTPAADSMSGGPGLPPRRPQAGAPAPPAGVRPATLPIVPFAAAVHAINPAAHGAGDWPRHAARSPIRDAGGRAAQEPPLHMPPGAMAPPAAQANDGHDEAAALARPAWMDGPAPANSASHDAGAAAARPHQHQHAATTGADETGARARAEGVHVGLKDRVPGAQPPWGAPVGGVGGGVSPVLPPLSFFGGTLPPLDQLPDVLESCARCGEEMYGLELRCCKCQRRMHKHCCPEVRDRPASYKAIRVACDSCSSKPASSSRHDGRQGGEQVGTSGKRRRSTAGSGARDSSRPRRQ